MKNNNLIAKFLSFSYGSFIGLFVGLLTTMITTRVLNPIEFGKASMFTLAINVCMVFIIFGTDQSFVRFYFEESESKRGGLLYNCLKILLIIALLSFLILLFLNKPIAIFLFGEYDKKAIFLLGFGIIVQALYRFAVLVIRMQKKGHLFSLLEILNRTFQLLLVLLFYFFLKGSYLIIIYSTVITYLILTIFSFFQEKQMWSFKNIFMKNQIHSKQDILKYSYPLVLTSLITWLFQSFDRIALRNWSSFNELGLFAAAFKIVALLNVVQTAFTTFWTPVCYEQFERDPNNTYFYEKVSKIVAFSMFILAILTIIFKDLFIILLGSNYEKAIILIPFMVFMPMMYTISETTVIGINFFKKPKLHIVISVIACLVNIIVNWLLVPKYGAIGASISTALAYIVFFGFRTFFSLRYYKVNYGLRKVYLMVILILMYGYYSIFHLGFLENCFVGLILLLIILLIYKKDFQKYFTG